MNCFNLSRKEVLGTTDIICPNTNAWISINEPGKSDTESEVFDAFDAKLKLKFWDVVTPTPFIGIKEGLGEFAMPPSEEDAKTIVDFILQNKNKNFYVNCAAGISRSGAICYFLEEYLKFNWSIPYKRRAVPNTLLFKMMSDYYLSFNTKPTKIIDKRRMNYFDIK